MKSGKASKKRQFSPCQFLRSRRPELFSDTMRGEKPTIDRSLLEYHLDKITSRGQESDFERFSRQLAEREICPNLLPHTGPAGGGDSKVDSETYPVADALSLTWYAGIGREAASERWAFAFSAKKQWRPKVKSDLAKIAGTDRGYAKAFFVTNQFVADKERAKIEDELRDAHGLDVRILDRSWILDRVFGSGHEDLAINELRLEASTHLRVRKGPLDTEREQDLEDLEERIQKAAQETEFTRAAVDDALHAAILARGLEKPRFEVDGRLARAERIAERHGSRHQRLEGAYNTAWTTFWWYEDYDEFAKVYKRAEELAKGSRNAYHLELLTNLWFLLYATVGRGQLNGDAVSLGERSRVLASELERLSKEEERPSTALQARTLRLQMQLTESALEDVDTVLAELQEVVESSEGLVGFPFEPLVDVLTELGGVIGDRPAYESLFETIVEVAARREGEVATAQLLTRRGAQQLEQARPYEAIKSLGRALRFLYKHESRYELVQALYLCGSAYQRVGLKWAARGSLLTAASVATNELWSYEKVTPLQAACYERMGWLELELGRLPHVLAWHETLQITTQLLAAKGYRAARLEDDALMFDGVLGLLLLRGDLSQLNAMEGIPDTLEDLGLPFSSIALLYALGWVEEVPEDLLGTLAKDETLEEYFRRWRDQPAATRLPGSPELCNTMNLTLSSRVLGCDISVICENVTPGVEFGETLLAALESLLSTSILQGVIAREPVLTVSIKTSDFTEQPFRFSIEVRGSRPHLDLICQKFSAHRLTPEEHVEVKKKLFELLVDVIPRVFLISDEQVLVRLFEDEHAIERAIHFTTSLGTTGNVLGHEPKTRLSDWFTNTGRQYQLKRTEAWDTAFPFELPDEGEGESPRPGEGEPPAELRDPEQMRHDEIKAISLVNDSLWHQAQWIGTAFIIGPDTPPILAPIFQDPNAASQIFSQWIEELGEQDTEELLRVSIVRGITTKNPYAYIVVFGSNPNKAFLRGGVRYTVMYSRQNRMEPTSPENLDRFLQSYMEHGKYRLVPAIMTAEGPVPALSPGILKTELHVREAWEIGRHDPDIVAIKEDEEIVHPPRKADHSSRRSKPGSSRTEQ